MKRCPSCGRMVDDDSQSFCLSDGSRLVSDAAPPPAADDYLQATIMAPPSMQPSGELPPPDAYATNSGQLNQPPPPQPNPAWPPANPYEANQDPWANQQPQSTPLPQSPSWQTPSAPLPTAPAKRGMNTKLLIGGGLGCLGLLVVGVVVIALAVFLNGPSSKMNPYKGSLRDLAPASIGSFSRVDIDTLGDRDKDGFGRVRDAIGLAYKSSDEKVEVFIGNYDSADDAKDGLKSFKDRLSSRGWTITFEEQKKIGRSTVGSKFYSKRKTASNNLKDGSLAEGARLVYTQAATASPAAKTPSIVCWTNGSVLYAVASDSYYSSLFEAELDKAQK